MTCSLLLTRHTKSDWSTEAPSDHQRPLNRRGQNSAEVLGSWIRGLSPQYRPRKLLSSSAERTRETFEWMDLDIPSFFTERLYLATPEVILNVLQNAEEKHLLLIGHNPGLMEFAHQIVKQAPYHSRFEDYPTGATLLLEFDIDKWADLRLGSGRSIDFVVPRELLGEPA